jgi:hypothetical protein
MASSKLSQDNSRSKNSHHSVSISPNGASIQTGRGIQSVRDQIEKAFAPLRTIERRRYAKPGELNPAIVGRRKDDPPRLQLAQLAQPILQQIKATGTSAVPNRKGGAAIWDIGEAPEVSDADLPKLLESCEIALGLKKLEIPTRPQTCSKDQAETQTLSGEPRTRRNSKDWLKQKS